MYKVVDQAKSASKKYIPMPFDEKHNLFKEFQDFFKLEMAKQANRAFEKNIEPY